MTTTQSRADSFVHTFAQRLLDRAGLQLDEQNQKRYIADIERAIHQRLGVAAFERLGEAQMEDVAKDVLHGASSDELTQKMQTYSNPPSNFIAQELEAFSTEFLQAVVSN